MRTKIIILLSGCISMCLSSFGQIRFVPSDPYNNYSIGLNIGYTTMYGDLSQSNPSPAFILNLSKHMTSTVVIGIEAQHGELSSTEPANKWTTGLSSVNQFNSLNVNGKVTLAQLIKNPHNLALRALSNLYLGTGVGIIDNDLTTLTDKFKASDATTIDADEKKSSIALVVPVNLGLNIYLKKFLGYRGAQFNVNYQLGYAFSDYVDGYSFSSSYTKNKYNDVYSILSVGIAIYIGHVDEYQ